MISLKTPREVELMAQSGALAAKTLEYIGPFIVPGVSTEKINQLCHDFIIQNGGHPSCLGYRGFPKSVCTSPNHVICHGIPSKDVILRDGDLLNVDVTVYLNSFHGDTNKTYLVGNVSPETQKLVSVTYECMKEGIKAVRPGGHLGDIGAAILEVAHGHGFSVVEEYCGHGIGREFHEGPQVSHVGHRGKGHVIRPGMTFTVEPMINLGARHCQLLDDGWTVVTKDRRWSAQFEHTLVATEEGSRILTLRAEEDANDFQ